LKEVLIVKTNKGLHYKATDWILKSDGVILLNPEVYRVTSRGEKIVLHPALFPGVKLTPNEIESFTRIQVRG